ncbi:VOC family protein [Marinomonas sp. 2405UD68-3]|uniref:VOC family protein n=1 Tax=Marinomonas sp. 2405UD68-3 TaxID=3391835 RepID=UPI0039C963CC
MNDFGLSFHHLGLAVRQSEGALTFLKGLGYTISPPVYDHNQKVNLIMCTSSYQPNIELIFPSEDAGPLDNILKSHDTLIYHTCYESVDIDNSIQKIKDNGHRVLTVSDKKQAPLFEGRLVAFYFIKGMGLIEILEGNK